MKASTPLMLVAVAGCAAGTALGQVHQSEMIQDIAMPLAKHAPKIVSITRVTTGQTAYFPQLTTDGADRMSKPFDTINDPDSFGNMSWVNGAGYSGGASNIWLNPMSIDPGCLVNGGGWSGPTDNAGFVTDIQFNFYAADAGLWPAATLDDIANVNQVELNFTNINTEETGGVSDFRTSNFTVLFYDNNGVFVDGFNFTQALDPDEGAVWFFTVDLTSIGGVDIPGQGIMVFDYVDAEPPALSGDCGYAVNTAGGFIIDTFGTNPAPVGDDGVAIPDADSQILAADQAGFRDFLDSNWFFQASENIDPTLDGNPSDTTYTDALLGPNGVNWSFTRRSDGGNDPAGRYGSPHTMAFSLQVDAIAPTNCEADLSGSVDPNSPDFGVPDGTVDGVDFFFYLGLFGAGDLGADLTGSVDPNNPAFGVPDGTLDGSDFFFYLGLFDCCNGAANGFPCTP